MIISDINMLNPMVSNGVNIGRNHQIKSQNPVYYYNQNQAPQHEAQFGA